MKRVFAFGTFDGVHTGHRDYLAQARSNGDQLTVVVANDANVARTKHHRPELGHERRRDLVAATGLADRVIVGSPERPLDIFERESIDVVVLGYDQQVSLHEVRRAAARCKQSPLVVRARAYYPWLWRTRLLKRLGSIGRKLRGLSY